MKEKTKNFGSFGSNSKIQQGTTGLKGLTSEFMESLCPLRHIELAHTMWYKFDVCWGSYISLCLHPVSARSWLGALHHIGAVSLCTVLQAERTWYARRLRRIPDHSRLGPDEINGGRLFYILQNVVRVVITCVVLNCMQLYSTTVPV